MNAIGASGERVRNRLVRILGRREIWALTDQSVVSGTNFLTNVMLARFMGLREFGVFVLAWMSVLFVNSLQAALIVAPMMSIAPQQDEKDRPQYFGAVVVQELVLVSFCFVLVFVVVKYFGSFFHDSDIQHLAAPLAASAFAYQMQDFIRRYFFATHQNHRALADDALSYIPQLPIVFMLHHAGHLNSATALWVMAGTSIAGVVAGWFWVEPLRFDKYWIRTVAQRHWKMSRWLSASALLQWTSGNLFVIAAPVYYGAAAAGVLRASQNLMGVTHIWFQGLDNVVPVETARRLRQGGVHSMLTYTRSILMKWGGMTLLFAIVMAVAPGFWLRLMYGPGFSQYAYVLRLYALLYCHYLRWRSITCGVAGHGVYSTDLLVLLGNDGMCIRLRGSHGEVAWIKRYNARNHWNAVSVSNYRRSRLVRKIKEYCAGSEHRIAGWRAGGEFL